MLDYAMIAKVNGRSWGQLDDTILILQGLAKSSSQERVLLLAELAAMPTIEIPASARM